MIVSKVTSKPDDHPAAGTGRLGIAEGDEVAYIIEPGRVILRKAPPRSRRRYPRCGGSVRHVHRMDSDADRTAFANL